MALIDGEGFGLFTEKCREHHFGGTASGQEFGVQNMNRMSQNINVGIFLTYNVAGDSHGVDEVALNLIQHVLGKKSGQYALDVK